MKRLLLLVLTLSLLAACNNSAKVESSSVAKNSDLTQANLKGRVQHYEETSYTVDSTGNNKMDSLSNMSDFDEKGYQTKYATKDQAGKIHREDVTKHDDQGNFTEMTTTSDGKQTYKLEAESKDGKYTGGKTYDSTGRQDSYFTDLATNEYGIVYAGKQHFMDGRIKGTWDNKYNGVTYVSGTSTDSTGKVVYTGSVKANDKGDAIEEEATTTEKGATKTEKFTYTYDSYDDAGNWTQRTTYNEKGKPTKIVKRAFTYYKG
jgi:hypothetical protein